jgi:branched-chain amino acid transport system permease protein
MYALQQLINALTAGGVYALIAVGFAIVFNILKFSNWSYGATIMLSSYVGFYVASRFHLQFLPVLLIAMVSGGAIAVLIELIAFRNIRRKKGPVIYYFVTSISVSTGVQFLMLTTVGGDFHGWPRIMSEQAIHIGGLTISALNLWMGGACLMAVLLLNFVLFRTRMGMAVRAAACNLPVAALMGVNINQVIAFIFFLSGAMGGLVGTLMGVAYTTYPEMGVEAMIKGFVAAIVGGLGSITGAVLGGFLLALVETIVITTPLGSSATPVVVFVLLIVLLFIRPTGIAGKASEEKV